MKRFIRQFFVLLLIIFGSWGPVLFLYIFEDKTFRNSLKIARDHMLEMWKQ